MAAVEGILGIGAIISTDGDPSNEIQVLVQSSKALNPKMAEMADQLHHMFPKYLGGDPNGPTVLLNPAYHQLITNAFRQAWAYGQGAPPLEQSLQIRQQVYEKFPLP